jgi:hypothetical protein
LQYYELVAYRKIIAIIISQFISKYVNIDGLEMITVYISDHKKKIQLYILKIIFLYLKKFYVS